MTPPGVLDRVGGRVLVLDGAGRVLLLHGTDPADPGAGSWWFTPGGGADEGESVADAARRELAEETGLVVPDVGRPVWVRMAEFSFVGRQFRQHETFFLVRVPSHDVDASGWTDLERESVHGWHWWPLDELEASGERVYPRALVVHLRRLLVEGPPTEPVDVGP